MTVTRPTSRSWLVRFLALQPIAFLFLFNFGSILDHSTVLADEIPLALPAVGDAAEFTVNFGVNSGGVVTASVANATKPAKIAA